MVPRHRLTNEELDRHLTQQHRLAHQPGLWQTWQSWLRRVAATAALVQSATGPCVVNGDCVCSSNFQAASCAATSDASRRYGNDEACNVTFAQPVALHVHLFSTERGSDLLFADGARYSGTHGPDGVVASALSWHSDDSTRRSGFKICAHPVPAPPPPPAPAAPHAPPWPELAAATKAAAAAAAAAAAGSGTLALPDVAPISDASPSQLWAWLGAALLLLLLLLAIEELCLRRLGTRAIVLRGRVRGRVRVREAGHLWRPP
jgi:hypothetical protein